MSLLCNLALNCLPHNHHLHHPKNKHHRLECCLCVRNKFSYEDMTFKCQMSKSHYRFTYRHQIHHRHDFQVSPRMLYRRVLLVEVVHHHVSCQMSRIVLANHLYDKKSILSCVISHGNDDNYLHNLIKVSQMDPIQLDH